jgi:plasmid stabilization system protein ParE
MNYSLNITDLAEEDILATVRYISEVLKNPVAANNLLDEIERHEKILEDTPNIYPFVRDEYLSEKGLKFARIKNYLIFYTIDEDNKIVNVIRFLYGRRDWKNILLKIEMEY